MSIRTLACALALAAPVCAQANEQLYGTWKLKSFVRVIDGERTNLFGVAPKGFLAYSRDGRMYAILTHETRPKPADMAKITDAERVELFNSMFAYAGTFSVKGNVVTHSVDISWNENWTGTNQLRNIKLEGNKLSIATNPVPNAFQGKTAVFLLEWEKVPQP